MTSEPLCLLRVYTDIAAVRGEELFWKVLIDRARSMGIANAAVLQVLDAFGQAAIVHDAKAIDLEPGHHVIVEVIDKESVVRSFRDTLELTDDVGLVVLETVNVVGYGGHRHHSPGAN